MNKLFYRPIQTLLGLTFALLLTVGLSTQAHAMRGSGTEADPYVITSASDLAAMHNDLSAHYALGSSIYMTGVKHTPIGNEDEGAFTGSLDGKGYTIHNLTVSDAGSKYAGLFGYVEGSVTNLTLSNVTVTGGRYLGGVAGYVSEGASLSACHVTSGSITCSTALMDIYMGGIVGRCDGTLSGSLTNGADLTEKVEQAIYAGGITGYLAAEADLTDCTNSGAISGGTYSGGLVGYVSNADALTFTDCTNSGAIVSSNSGGLVGRVNNVGTLTFTDCTNSGSSQGYWYSGGLVGSVHTRIRLTVNNCTNSGNISCTNAVGGLVATVSSIFSTLTDCINFGDLTCYGYEDIGGMVGLVPSSNSTLIITNCTNFGKIISTSYSVSAGGMVGESFANTVITDCTNAGEIFASSSGNVAKNMLVGGMIGHELGAVSLTNCSNSANVSIQISANYDADYIYCGGIIAGAEGGDTTINSCTNSGDISVSGIAGGFYNTYSGGIAGYFYSTTTVTDSTNFGNISSPRISSAIGYFRVTADVSNCSNYGNLHSRTLSSNIHPNYRDLYFHNTGAGLVVYDGDSEPGIFLSTDGIKLHRYGSEGWYCSDIRYGADFTGTPKTFAQLRDPSLYTSWDVETGQNYGWVVDPVKNSGLPFPEDMRTDLFNESVLFLTPGQASQLTAEFEVAGWESSDPEVVSCSNGTVTALHPGAVGVAAYSSDGKHRANCIIYVYRPVSRFTVTPGSSALAYGATTTMTTDLYKDYPNDPQAIHWTSSDPAVATVDAAGKVTAKGGGTVTITGYAPLSGVSASCTITVTTNITGLSLPSTQTIYAGEPTPLSCTVTPTVYTGTLGWTSSDESVVTVQGGILTGLKPGISIITVTSDTGVSDTCTVTVLQRSTSLSLDRSSLTLEMGLTDQLIATILPENTTDTLSWSSNSTSVVTVSSTGVLTPKRTGQAIITCSTTSGLKAYCTVTVVNKAVLPTSVTLDQHFLRPNVGVKTQLKATLSPSNSTNATITWSSSNSNVATVNSTGVVEAVAPGTAIITAASHNGFYDTCEVKVSVTSSAAFILTSDRARPGDTVSTQVHIAKNPGVAAMALGLDYDTAMLTPIAVEPGPCLQAGTFTSNLEELGSNPLRVTWYSDQDMTENGLAFTVTWQISSQAQGSIPISLSFSTNDICNQEPANVPFTIEPCTVEIVNYLLGDIYRDELVNMKDIVYLARWFNQLETLDDMQLLAADLHRDRTVDVKDLTVLSQHLTAALPEPSVQMFRLTRTAPFSVSLSDAIVDENGCAVVTVTGENCPGIAALRFALRLPQGYTVTAVTPTPLLSSGVFEFNADTGIVAWHHTQPIILDGTLFTIAVQADNSAPNQAEMALDYSAADFFTLPGYADVPVVVSSGVIETQHCSIASAQLNDSGLIVTIGGNRSGSSRMIIASYSGTRFLGCTMQDISLSQPTHILPYTPHASCNNIKIFILGSDDAYIPICLPFEFTP